ncbi:Uncharacterised protein [Paucimonas lemoignei]|jgi:hypothetical protein|nr:Uncharacterised protein [Paucimonas lemoignei]
MNIALSVLNAAALVALVAFHFQDDGKTEQVAAQAQPHHLLRQAPQLAVMTERSGQAAVLANNNSATAPVKNDEPRWVF